MKPILLALAALAGSPASAEDTVTPHVTVRVLPRAQWADPSCPEREVSWGCKVFRQDCYGSTQNLDHCPPQMLDWAAEYLKTHPIKSTK